MTGWAQNWLGRRGTVASAAALTVTVAAVAAAPHLLGRRVGAALDQVGQASPAWVWLGVLGFVGSLVGAAGAWRSAVGLCGGRLGQVEANGRYGVGSLVNTFLPARIGDGVRLALFSRSIDHRHRLLSAGSAVAAVGAARAVGLAALVVCGAALGALPLWPLLVLAGIAAAAGTIAWKARGGHAHSRLAHLLDAFGTLGREPLAGLRIVGWIGLATLGRVGAAAAMAAALGVPAPLVAALIVVPALDLAGIVPLTPGNFGITSGAVAVALQVRGVGVTQALSTGIAFHAVETAVGVLYGLLGVVIVAGSSLQGGRRLLLVGVAASAVVAVAGAFAATVLADLV